MSALVFEQFDTASVLDDSGSPGLTMVKCAGDEVDLDNEKVWNECAGNDVNLEEISLAE